VPTLCNLPTVDFSSVTNGGQVDFTDASSVTGGSTIWAWDFGDGNGSSLQNPSHTYGATGTYNVTLVLTDDCGVDSVSYVIDVFICTNPVPSFTVTDNEPNYILTNTSTVVGTTTYSWDMGDLTTYTTPDANHTYATNGTYTVTLIVTDSCGVDSVTQDITVSIIGLSELEAGTISVYPVPATEQLTVVSTVNISEIEVIDLSGRAVLIQNANSNELVVSTVGLAEGEYLLKINLANGQTEVRRITLLN
jgi:PKD repeat protein